MEAFDVNSAILHCKSLAQELSMAVQLLSTKKLPSMCSPETLSTLRSSLGAFISEAGHHEVRTTTGNNPRSGEEDGTFALAKVSAPIPFSASQQLAQNWQEFRVRDLNVSLAMSPGDAKDVEGPLGLLRWLAAGCVRNDRLACGDLPADLPAVFKETSDAFERLLGAVVPSVNDLCFARDPQHLNGRAHHMEQIYALRDALQWMEAWMDGPVTAFPFAAMLMGFITVVDDVIVEPNSVAAGSYSFLNVPLRRIFAGVMAEIRSTGYDAAWIPRVYEGVVAAAVLQAGEKVMDAGGQVCLEHFPQGSTLHDFLVRAEYSLAGCVAGLICCMKGVRYTAENWRACIRAGPLNTLSNEIGKYATATGLGCSTDVREQGATRLQTLRRLVTWWDLLSDLTRSDPPAVRNALLLFVKINAAVGPVSDRYSERLHAGRLPLRWPIVFALKGVLQAAEVDECQLSVTGEVAESLGAPATQGPVEASTQPIDAIATRVSDYCRGVGGVHSLVSDFLAKPTVGAFYKLPRIVRLALQYSCRATVGKDAPTREVAGGATRDDDFFGDATAALDAHCVARRKAYDVLAGVAARLVAVELPPAFRETWKPEAPPPYGYHPVVLADDVYNGTGVYS